MSRSRRAAPSWPGPRSPPQALRWGEAISVLAPWPPALPAARHPVSRPRRDQKQPPMASPDGAHPTAPRGSENTPRKQARSWWGRGLSKSKPGA